MGLPPAPSLEVFHAVATAIPSCALCVTAFRLIYRYQRRIHWWDDALVALASLFMILLVIGVWLMSGPHLSQSTKVLAYYLCTYTFSIANYAARESILLAVIRISPNPRMKRLLYLVVVFFFFVLCLLLAQKIWVCDGRDTSWKKLPLPDCPLGKQVAITELVTDIVCDSLLVFIPIRLLWRARLKVSQKRRLYAVFAASIATTVVSTVQDWLILSAGGLREETASMIEVSVSITVANLPVIVSAIFRFFEQHPDGTSGFNPRYLTSCFREPNERKIAPSNPGHCGEVTHHSTQPTRAGKEGTPKGSLTTGPFYTEYRIDEWPVSAEGDGSRNELRDTGSDGESASMCLEVSGHGSGSGPTVCGMGAVVEPAEGPIRVQIVRGSQPSLSHQSRTNPRFNSVRRVQRYADDKLDPDRCRMNNQNEPGFHRAPSRNTIGARDTSHTIRVSQHIVISTDPDPDPGVSGGYSLPSPLPAAVLPSIGGRIS